MYLFIVFCKDLLCIPFHFGSRTFICAFTIFCFSPSLTLFSCFHMGLVDLLISVFHLAFTRFESYGAPISGLLVLAYMSYQTMAFLFSRYRWLHFLLRCASSSMRWWLLCQSWHSAEPATMHNGALNTFNRPEWVVDAIWSNGSIEVWSNPTWFHSETNDPADEKGERSEIWNETGSYGRIECVCYFWRV